MTEETKENAVQDEEKKEEVAPEKPEFEKKLEEMRVENARMEKNIQELKELKAFDALSGKADAGQQVKPAEETPEEYARRALEGKM